MLFLPICLCRNEQELTNVKQKRPSSTQATPQKNKMTEITVQGITLIAVPTTNKVKAGTVKDP